MFDTLTLELIVLLIVGAGAVAGVSVSLGLRSRRLKRITNLNLGPTSELSEDITKISIQENSNDFHEFSQVSKPPISANETSQEEFHPSSGAPLVSAFKSKSPDAETAYPSSFSTDTVVVEATAPKNVSLISDPDIETHEYESRQEETTEKKTASEIATTPSPTADEPFFSSPSTERSPSSAPSPTLVLPTDNAALQKITQIPLPNGAQIVTSSTFSSAAGKQSGNAPIAYCVKCKSKKQIRDPSAVTMKNGRPAISGFCFECGTRVFRIGRASF